MIRNISSACGAAALLGLALLSSSALSAQPATKTKKTFTMREATAGSGAFYPRPLNNLLWRPGHNIVSWTNARQDTLYQYDVRARKYLNAEYLGAFNLRRATGPAWWRGPSRPNQLAWQNREVRWLSDDELASEFEMGDSNIIASYNIKDGTVKVQAIHSLKGRYADVHPVSLNRAYVQDNNLYINVRGESGPRRVTYDDKPGLINGEQVARNEFGINKGTFWSPKGNKLAWYKKDESQVTEYPLLDINERPGDAEMIRYPMAGMRSQQVSVWVYDVEARRSTRLKVNSIEAEQYLINPTWSPDEKFIYLTLLNRDQNHMYLRRYDAGTGDELNTLFEERDDKYVEPLTPPFFPSARGDMFIWLSRRDGYNHAYQYDAQTGQMLRQVSSGEWEVTSIIGASPAGDELFLEGTLANTAGKERQLYKFDLVRRKSIPITVSSGVHSGTLSPDGRYLVDDYQSATQPRITQIIDSKRGVSQVVLQNIANPFRGYALPNVKLLTLKASDGTDLNARIITPPNMDSTKKYPVIVYVYGGPHAQMIDAGWMNRASLWMYKFAQEGYIIFTLDNRGSEHRGKAFEQVTFRQLGKVEMQDQLTGVAYLKSLRFVDPARLGVFGWSFGGFMTTSLMTNYPNVFTTAVAGGPVMDWSYYEIMYTERYMDSPKQNPAGYESTALVKKADKLQGRLLLIHGMLDDVVLMQHSLMFLSAAVKANKQVDYFVYPDAQHNVRGKPSEHLYTKILDYFQTHLPAGAR